MNDPLVDRDYFVKADAFVDGKERRKKKKRKEKENRKTKLEPDAYMYTKGTRPRETLRPNKASAVHLESNLASVPT